MDPRDFAIERQRDEATHGQGHLPTNSSFEAAACGVAPYSSSLPGGCQTLGDSSTRINQYYTPQPTFLAPFQSDQQPPNFTDYIPVQEAGLPVEVQQELAEAEWRYTAARYEILEKAQAFPVTSNTEGTTVSYADSAIGERASGFTGVSDRPSVPVNLRQISSNTNASSPGTHSGEQVVWSTVYPNAFQDHTQNVGRQDDTVLNAQNLYHNAFGHATYGQQSAVDPMAFALSNHDTIATPLSKYEQGNHPLFQPRYTQSAHPMQGVGLFPVSASDLTTYPTVNSSYDMTASCVSPLWIGGFNSSAGHSLTMTPSELPSFPTMDHSATADVDMTGTNNHPLPTGAGGEHIRLAKRKFGVSSSASNSGTQSGCALENIYFYTDPKADRQHSASQPKRRRVTEKAPSSCFGCRTSKRKCTIMTGDICLRCQDILKTYSDRTRLPKFTCNVRTKFSEMSIFADVPTDILFDTEISTDILFDIEISTGVRSGFSRPLPVECDFECFITNLVGNLRGFLDILEPLHTRQIGSPDFSSSIRFSYLLSAVRWKDAICFFWPKLSFSIHLMEKGLGWLQRDVLRVLDCLIASKDWQVAMIHLNVLYEGLSTMVNTPTVDIPAKQHLLSSLVNHMSHLYHILLPAIPGRRNSQDQAQKALLKLRLSKSRLIISSQASKFLPADYISVAKGNFGQTMMWWHKVRCFHRPATPGVTDPTSSPEFPEQASRFPLVDPSRFPLSDPLLDTYPPSWIADAFRMDKRLFEVFECIAQNYLLEQPPSIQRELILLSPWAISIGLRAFLEGFDIGSCTNDQNDAILQVVVVGSFEVWSLCLKFHGGSESFSLLADYMMADRDALEAFLIESIAHGVVANHYAKHGIFKERLPKTKL